MTLLIVICLLVGIFAGYFFISPEIAALSGDISNIALFFLLFFVGISIGSNKEALKSIRYIGFKVLLVPLGTIIGSLLAGAVCSLLLKMSLQDGLGIGMGLGWYSLSGGLLTDLSNSSIGTISFLSNIVRELLAVMLLPMLAKYTNEYTALAPAGVNSQDMVIPMYIKCVGQDKVVIALFNGICCSFAVPLIINIIYLF
ncbi:MAG: lysine exporter LysO family protein [Oscillospiraceae bacterium]